MTRDEFRRRLQIDRHVRAHGVTVCPPGAAIGVQAAALVEARRRGATRMIVNAAQRMVGHPHDESGAPEPIRIRRTDSSR
jgi:hypothetical protein